MKIKFISIVFFILLLCMPIFQYTSDFLPRKRLTNISVSKRFPTLDLNSFLKGDFQGKFESWFLKNHGFWGLLVTTANQINFTLFNQLSAGYRGLVQVGRHNWLFQRPYLDDANGRHINQGKLLRSKAKRLKKMQDHLAAEGKTLVVLVTPNKVSSEPAMLPNRLRSESFRKVRRNYHRMIAALEKNQVNHIDGPALLKSWQEKLGYSLFTPSGSHYNSVGACRVAAEITALMQSVSKEPVPQLKCQGEVQWKAPKREDRDLSYLLNIWYPQATYAPTPYIEPSVDGTQIKKPEMLFVGTSFLWSVISSLEQVTYCQRCFFFYYYRTNYFYYPERKGPESRGKHSLNWQKQNFEGLVFSNDVIVLEANEAFVNSLGFEFIRDYLRFMRTKKKRKQ